MLECFSMVFPGVASCWFQNIPCGKSGMLCVSEHLGHAPGHVTRLRHTTRMPVTKCKGPFMHLFIFLQELGSRVTPVAFPIFHAIQEPARTIGASPSHLHRLSRRDWRDPAAVPVHPSSLGHDGPGSPSRRAPVPRCTKQDFPKNHD